jgi:protein-S-isoprenylcysteine O-methyltransferase Ste14
MMNDAPVNSPDRTPVKKWAKVRLWTGYVFLLLAIIFAKPTLPLSILGIVLVLVGITTRLISTATLIKDKELCTSGIYAATRNPLYFGSALIGLGVASITSSWWFLAGFLLVLVPIYMHMITLEEIFLKSLFPDTFPSYMKSVPRFFPRLSALSKLAGTLDRAKLKKSREISSAALTIIVVILILTIPRPWLP